MGDYGSWHLEKANLETPAFKNIIYIQFISEEKQAFK